MEKIYFIMYLMVLVSYHNINCYFFYKLKIQ